MAYQVPGLANSTGMTVFEPLPAGEYLLKVVALETTDKVEGNTVVGTTFAYESVVENADNLPEGTEKSDVVGRSFKDFIFVMTPDHPKYNEKTKRGTPMGMIGVDTLKSFLDSVGVAIRADGFNEKAPIGRYFEATVGTRTYKDKTGADRTGNQINAYRPAGDVGSASETDAEIPAGFEDDLA